MLLNSKPLLFLLNSKPPATSNRLVTREINPDKIIQAINEINNKLKKDSNHYKENSLKRAKEFDTDIFIKEIKKEIQKCLNQN